MTATAVTIYHPTDAATFTTWATELRASAPDATEFRLSVLDVPSLEWGVAVSFADPAALHGWLDGAARRAVLRSGAGLGILRATSDLVIAEDTGVPSGVGVFRLHVAAGRGAEFVAAETRLAEACAVFEGFEGLCAFAPADGGDSMSVLRFRTEDQLARWLGSAERAAVLPPLRSSLTREFSVVSSTTTFGATVRTENGRTAVTPKWKTAMLILFVLYPTVMLLSRFLGPALARLGAEPWLAVWLSQVVSVAALQWLLMPWAGRRFRRWLDPVAGAGVRPGAAGATVVVAGYLAALALFASVPWLQFWDYSR